MANELVVIEQATALDLFKAPAKAQELVNYVAGEVAKELVELEGLDLNVGVNRNKYISLAAKVTKTKTYVEGIGKEIAADLKKLPKLVDESRKLIKDQLDRLSEEVRKPATDWEIADEERKAAEELARIMPYLHAEALEMNAEHDKLIAEKEAQRIAHEEGLKKQAAEQARLAAEQKAQQEIEAAAQREREAKEAAERAEREKQEAIQRAEQEAKEAQERAEREKQSAIEAERKKAREAEQARLAEEERKRQENAKRQADKEHQKAINNKAMQDLIDAGIPEECAKNCIIAIAKSLVSNVKIHY
nr:cell envelope biogenesis protein TolA [Providencia rettgeri]